MNEVLPRLVEYPHTCKGIKQEFNEKNILSVIKITSISVFGISNSEFCRSTTHPNFNFLKPQLFFSSSGVRKMKGSRKPNYLRLNFFLMPASQALALPRLRS